MPLSLITAPTDEPITLEEAKAHLRVEIDDEDNLIAALISAARIECENELKRSLMPQTLELTRDWFDPTINLPMPPVVSITSVKYLDATNALTTLDPTRYTLDSASEPGRLIAAFGYDWPVTTSLAINAVRVRYVAGYADSTSVPESIKTWLKIRVATLYENRQQLSTEPRVTVQQVPFVGCLLDRYRIVQVF